MAYDKLTGVLDRVRGEDGAWYRPGTRRWVGVLRLWAEDIAAWAATAAISKEGR